MTEPTATEVVEEELSKAQDVDQAAKEQDDPEAAEAEVEDVDDKKSEVAEVAQLRLELVGIKVSEIKDHDIEPRCLCDVLCPIDFEVLPVESLKLLRSAVYLPTAELVTMLQDYGVQNVSTEDYKSTLLHKLRTILEEDAKANAGIAVLQQEKELIARLKETRAERSAIECCVCFINLVSVAYVPCGHAISCEECARKIEFCPLCQVKFKEILKLYFA